MINSITPLELTVRNTIPLVYDDSMTFLELLGAVVVKINEMAAFFDADLLTTVTNILTAWQNNGTLSTLLSESALNAIDEFTKTLQGYPINVKDFGAVGNNLTINTAALQQAITAAAGVRSVLIPDGIFLTDKIDIPNNSHLIILGTLKLHNQANNQLIQLNGKNVVLDGMGKGILDGNGSNQAIGLPLAILYNYALSAAENVLIKGLNIKNSKEWGMNLNGLNIRVQDCVFSNNPNMNFFGPNSRNCIFSNCVCYGVTNDHALGFYGGVTDCTMDSCIVYNTLNTVLAGIAVINDAGQTAPNKNVVISNCISHHNDGPGFAVWGVNNFEETVSFINCVAHHNNQLNFPAVAGSGFVIKKAKNIIISSCQSHDNGNGSGGATGIFIEGGYNVIIKGNIIRNEGIGSASGYGIMITLGNNITIEGNTIFDDQSPITLDKYIQIGAAADGVDIVNNVLYGIVANTGIYGDGNARLIKDNYRGFNPIGFGYTTPTMPVSGVTIINPSPYVMLIYIWGGSVSEIMIEGHPIGNPGGMVILQPSESIKLTYSALPYWKWSAQ